ncbi:MAG: 6-bladed beta-propeller [Candidatus Binatia bacterium]
MNRSGKRIFVFLCMVLVAGCAPKVVEKPVNLVWPNPPETPRIKYLRSFSGADEFGASMTDAWLESFFGKDSGRTLAKPYGVATDQEGRVYVTDTGQGMVWVFDEANKKVSFLGTSGQGALKTPIGIAVDKNGIVFVADAKLKRVYGFDQKGELKVAIGKKGELERPTGVAIDPTTNHLYVSDTRLHKIRVYDANNGEFVKEIGERGKEDGQFNFPTNLFIRGDKLYVTDTGNFRVQLLDLEGNFIRNVGKLGDRPGNLARPKGVAADSENHIYVVDAAFDNFQIFDEKGGLLLFVGQAGSQPGRFWLPAGIHIDEKDRVYVVDSYNHRVQVFQYLGENQRDKATKATNQP